MKTRHGSARAEARTSNLFISWCSIDKDTFWLFNLKHTHSPVNTWRNSANNATHTSQAVLTTNHRTLTHARIVQHFKYAVKHLLDGGAGVPFTVHVQDAAYQSSKVHTTETLKL